MPPTGGHRRSVSLRTYKETEIWSVFEWVPNFFFSKPKQPYILRARSQIPVVGLTGRVQG